MCQEFGVFDSDLGSTIQKHYVTLVVLNDKKKKKKKKERHSVFAVISVSKMKQQFPIIFIFFFL